MSKIVRDKPVVIKDGKGGWLLATSYVLEGNRTTTIVTSTDITSQMNKILDDMQKEMAHAGR